MTVGEYHRIPEISWSFRNLLAATGVAVCIFLTAFNAAASTRQVAEVRAEEKLLADEARIVAALAAHLADETSKAREAMTAPKLKPAQAISDFVAANAAIDDLIEWDVTTIPDVQADAEQHRCLAQAIYYEARSESRIGQLAVADVVLNRVDDRRYPNTICGVVFEGHTRKTGCQFSFTCDGSMDRALNRRLWRESEKVATAVLSGMRLPISRQATHYHANYVNPVWASRLTPTAVIGKHKFYRFKDRRIKEAAPVAM